jgi:hypothetical protein
MSDCSAASASSGRRYRGWLALAVFLIALVLAVGGILGLSSARPSALARDLPDNVLFPFHAALGTFANAVGLSPLAAALQWTRAASHARSPAETAQAARGIAGARARAPTDRILKFTVCALHRRGSPRVMQATDEAGLGCAPDPIWRDIVSEGATISYPTRPPTFGPHYAAEYPTYGVIDRPVLTGYWMTNLIQGAVVLLYNCPGGCPELLNQIRSLDATLPAGRNSHGVPRLLAIPYSDMDHRLAVVAWGDVDELDQLDSTTIRAFYEANLDQGPECANYQCPD